MSDAAVIFPTVQVDLGPLGRHPLLYRIRDLAAMEEEWGSLGAMTEASESKPFTTLPRVLALGLRHKEGAPDEEALADLSPAVLLSDELQGAVSRALALALGQSPGGAEDPQ